MPRRLSARYTNEVANEPQKNIDANYGENFPRLLAIKKKSDPGNLFRLNANIDPSESAVHLQG
jgi:Berberine and berberine like